MNCRMGLAACLGLSFLVGNAQAQEASPAGGSAETAALPESDSSQAAPPDEKEPSGQASSGDEGSAEAAADAEATGSTKEEPESVTEPEAEGAQATSGEPEPEPIKVEPETPRTVVSIKIEGKARALRKQLNKQFLKTLTAGTDVVPPKEYRQAAQAAGAGKGTFYEPETVLSVAPSLGANHVLFITAPRRPKAVELKLFNLKSQRDVKTWELSVSRRKIGKAAMGEVGASVLEALQNSVQADAKAEEERLMAEAKAAKEQEAAAKAAQEAAAIAQAQADATAKVEAAQRLASEAAKLAADALEQAAKPQARNKVSIERETYSFAGGLLGVMRSASLTGKSTADSVTFDHGGFVPAFHARVTAHPFGKLGLGPQWLHGLGFDLQASLYGQDNREYGASVPGTLCGQLDTGLNYRYQLFDDATFPELIGRAGYGLFWHPLGGSSFPGTYYHSLYWSAGARYRIPPLPFKIPMIDAIDLFGSVGVDVPTIQSGGLQKLGDAGLAFGLTAEVGVVAKLGIFTVTALWTLDAYQSSFTGQSTLPRPTQFTDSQLSDDHHYLAALFGYTM